MHSRHFISLWGLVHKYWTLLPFFLILCGGCNTAPNSGAVSAGAENGRVTFVQWSDPHLFDAGAAREGKEIEEEQLDNWSALHWAVMQTNRLVLQEHRKIDFVVITGDFGLYNVKMELPTLKDNNGKPVPDKNCQHDAREGPGTPLSMDEAAVLVARELRALVVKKVYLVPGNNDLCDEDPRNRYRYAAFVLQLKKAIYGQQSERKENLAAAAASVVEFKKKKGINPPSSALAVEPPAAPEIVDLTFTLEKLYRAQDLRVLDLVGKLKPAEQSQYLQADGNASGGCSDKDFALPFENGFCLLGLDSSYFKLHDDVQTDIKTITAETEKASTEAMNTLRGEIKTGGSYLLFAHVPDMTDPAGRNADPGSSWKLSASARTTWKDALKQNELLAVFAGHFHSTNRNIYLHNFSYARELGPPIDPIVERKFWLSPSLAAKYQAGLPAPSTARGIMLFSVTRKGNGGVAASEVEALPIWFSPLTQKPPLPAEDKLAAALSLEEDGQWDQAAQKYLVLTSDPALDSTTREIALAGYERSHRMTEQWWWKSPPTYWFYMHRWGVLSTLLLLTALLLLFWLLRVTTVGRRLITLMKLFFLPRFKGKAKLNVTSAMTDNAPVKEFGAHMLMAAEEIRGCLMDEREPFMARHITLLTPSSSAFDTLLSSVPNVKGVDNVSAWLKFLSSLMQTFQWNIDSGIAVFAPDKSNSPPTGTTPPVLPPGGKLSGYAVLQWGWFIKTRFVQEADIVDNSVMRDLAQHLADLIIGEAFL